MCEEANFRNGICDYGDIAETFEKHIDTIKLRNTKAGVDWMEKQPWFRGHSGKYDEHQWVHRSVQELVDIPSEPEVQIKEQERLREIEKREKEEEEKQSKERGTAKYKFDMGALKAMSEDEFDEYLGTYKGLPSLAVLDRLSLCK